MIKRGTTENNFQCLDVNVVGTSLAVPRCPLGVHVASVFRFGIWFLNHYLASFRFCYDSARLASGSGIYNITDMAEYDMSEDIRFGSLLDFTSITVNEF